MKKIKEFAYARETRFVLPPGRVEAVVSLKIPDLSKNKVSMWGDWGPMYKFYLNRHQPVQIAYCQSQQEDPQHSELDINSVEINSPMLGQERSQYPLMYVIPDPQKLLVYHLYLNKDGHISRVKTVDVDRDHVDFECALCAINSRTGS